MPKSKCTQCTALIKYNTRKNNRVILHAQKATALQYNVFVTGIHRLVVIKTLSSTNHFQVQFQTPQSLSVRNNVRHSRRVYLSSNILTT